jgi:hypothetical protein
MNTATIKSNEALEAEWRLDETNFPGFININAAIKKYDTNMKWISRKLKLFKESKGKEVEVFQMGKRQLVRESELIEAFRIHEPRKNAAK